MNWAELAIEGIEALAVIIIVVVIIAVTIRYLYQKFTRSNIPAQYHDYRKGLARAILLGLEILIAADVVRTVILDNTFQSIGVLAILIGIRIVLSWSLMVEVEGRWPWQGKGKRLDEEKNEL